MSKSGVSTNRNQLWDNFLNVWPIERIKKLTIDEYSLGVKDSFCQWLEFETRSLGGIGGGSSYKFGVYKRSPTAKKPVPKENDTTYASDGTYGWKKKYGTTANEAFQNIKTIILNIIDKAGSGDFGAIDKIDFESLPKWKIAFLYQPKDHPTLLPIYDAKRLCKLVDMPEDSPVSKLQEKLISQKPAEMGLLEYYVDLLQKRRDVFERDAQSSPSVTNSIENDQKPAGGDSGIEIRKTIFNDLERQYREWRKGKTSTDDYIKHLKAISAEEKDHEHGGGYWFGLMKFLTGKQPSVGVFEVSSQDEFEKNYQGVIDLIEGKDKKQLSEKYSACKDFDEVFGFINNEFGNGTLRAAINDFRALLNHLETKVAADHLSEPGDQDNKPLLRNLIYFGAPGTGKSHQLKEAVEGKLGEAGKETQDSEHKLGFFVDVDKDKKIIRRRYERVTFYPTYSYAQFVGCYKPVMKPADGGKEEIAYEFVPGPFLRVLVDALKEPTHNHCLVIEEINRANAAAVFGDVFQLLDRGGKWNDGDDESIKPFFGDGAASEYDVAASEDIKRYLKEELANCKEAPKFLKVVPGKDENGNDIWKDCRLRIPSNMYIWATMNSADQGVFPMDTAFKRRWEFEYVDINNGAPDCTDWTVEGKGYKWDDLRRFANELLSLHHVNEDKLMGAHFVKPTTGTKIIPTRSFESKVLMYLWEDAARMCRRQVFGTIKTFSALLTAWKNSGIKIFENDTEINNLKDNKALYETLKNSPDVHDKPEPGASMDQPQP